MNVGAKDRVLIVTDRNQEKVGSALRKAALEVVEKESNVKLLVIEDLATRPLTELPGQIEKEIPSSTVTFWAATSLPGELTSRSRFLRKVRQYARHAHMPNITPEIMEQGMCADYKEVYDLTHKIYDLVKSGSKIEIQNDRGAEIVASFDNSWRWIPSDGRYYEKGRWGNLPEGEAFTAPKIVNGHFVTNLLGDWFSEKYGNFKETLSFDVKDSRIQFESIKCDNEALKKEIVEYLHSDENSNRASEFALPTNPLLISLPTIGNLLQDEKARPHIAFGDPYQQETGAPWTSKTHVDLLLEDCDVTVDGEKIMEDGKYVVV
jgi:aminopeptidase